MSHRILYYTLPYMPKAQPPMSQPGTFHAKFKRYPSGTSTTTGQFYTMNYNFYTPP